MRDTIKHHPCRDLKVYKLLSHPFSLFLISAGDRARQLPSPLAGQYTGLEMCVDLGLDLGFLSEEAEVFPWNPSE